MGRLKSIGNNTIFLELCLQEAIADVILYLKEGAGYDKWSNKCKSYRREATKHQKREGVDSEIRC